MRTEVSADTELHADTHCYSNYCAVSKGSHHHFLQDALLWGRRQEGQKATCVRNYKGLLKKAHLSASSSSSRYPWWKRSTASPRGSLWPIIQERSLKSDFPLRLSLRSLSSPPLYSLAFISASCTPSYTLPFFVSCSYITQHQMTEQTCDPRWMRRRGCNHRFVKKWSEIIKQLNRDQFCVSDAVNSFIHDQITRFYTSICRF